MTRQTFINTLTMSLDSVRSAGSSGQKSKRSLNPSCSDLSSNSKKQKKETNQKTLGAAWGSSSLSSSRSSFRKSPFSDFGSYMVEKNKKLHNQFNGVASNSLNSSSSSEQSIFRGVSIFVDGFTVPSSQELRGYMLKNGGRYENYFSRRRVTHIICSNLPSSKLKNLRSFSGGLPVVKPTWVVDSVAASKLLSWVPYQLVQLADNQPRLSAFFATKLSVEDSCLVNYDNELTSNRGSLLTEEDYLSEVGEETEYINQNGGESDDTAHQKIQTLIEKPTIGSEKSLEMKIAHTYNLDAEDDSSVKDSVQGGPSQPSASLNNYCLEASPNSPAIGSYGCHSTLTDPNFVENYFKSSRLHFIGTWRNRYRKRFPCQSKWIKNTNSNPSSADLLRTAIIHIDMDCFFVSVVIRNDHNLKDKPVAVSHSDSPKGTAEISSANYPARVYGVRAGMFVRDAKALCPHLVICPYNFEAYEEVADQFYNILHKHCKKVQAVSCDEAFLDVTDSEGKDPEILASTIRKEIFETTGCTASAGIAGNMLLSRLATRNAKPDGQCYIPPEKVDDYLRQLPIKELPGIGHVLQEKLKKRNVHTCAQLCLISKECLRKDFGAKTGEMLWNYSRGIDTRLVGMIQESKSIGAEVNWGVRFKDPKDSQNFLSSLCKEVSLRLQGCGVQGRSFILKIKKRRKDAEEPAKYLGCGDCENLSHSLTVPVATDDVEVLKRITKQLFGLFNIDVKEIRGIGLQVSKLENADSFRQGSEKNSLKSWLKSSSVSSEKCDYVPGKKTLVDCEVLRSDGICGQLYEETLVTNSVDSNPSNGESSFNSNSAPPPFSHLDFGVVGNLPPDIFSELNEIYGGKLVDFVAKSNSKGKGKVNEGERLPLHNLVHKDKLSSKDEPQPMPSVGGLHNFPRPDLENADIMPSSLSQVDTSVLRQLPQELRVDILEPLPAHRLQGLPLNSSLSPYSEHPYPLNSLNINEAENNLESTDSMSNNDLWVGSPPKWVDEFSENNCVILNILAEMYYKSGSSRNLSSILRCTTLEFQHIIDAPGYEGWDEALHKFSEVVKQYVKLKIEMDIEEIYICFRLIQRFMLKSKFLLHVYDSVFPYLQASVSESYGGNLHLPFG
ncbi:DNA repair protein REV1 [Humulus lupulus]|uniref:DNA repair protein REV1 n=1 Tax=Humulus lupulus TaxID=3486 RepID=UPI002B417F58|nr:DNA repair protein REV1 [Humulus lupulus]XP_062090077.1 DNA repair protein REV1 [Humulus lupulus]